MCRDIVLGELIQCRDRSSVEAWENLVLTSDCLLFQVELTLDGDGNCNVSSGIGFLDHMLTALTKHGRFDLNLTCKGDLEVDDHHSVEDIALALGRCGLELKCRDFFYALTNPLSSLAAPLTRPSESVAALPASATPTCPWTRPCRGELEESCRLSEFSLTFSSQRRH